MHFLGEIISLTVAVSWTVTALFAEIGSKRLGSLQMNVVRMVLYRFSLSVVCRWKGLVLAFYVRLCWIFVGGLLSV